MGERRGRGRGEGVLRPSAAAVQRTPQRRKRRGGRESGSTRALGRSPCAAHSHRAHTHTHQNARAPRTQRSLSAQQRSSRKRAPPREAKRGRSRKMREVEKGAGSAARALRTTGAQPHVLGRTQWGWIKAAPHLRVRMGSAIQRMGEQPVHSVAAGFGRGDELGSNGCAVLPLQAPAPRGTPRHDEASSGKRCAAAHDRAPQGARVSVPWAQAKP